MQSRTIFLCLYAMLCFATARSQTVAPAPRTQQQPSAPATTTPPTTAAADKGGYKLNYNGMPLSEVLEKYQEWTGKRVIADPHLESAVVTINTSGSLTKEEAIEFLEKSLLLAGYAIVPSGESMVKVLAFEAGGRNPASERVDMILREQELPKSDKVVSYILPLSYLKSDEAAQAFAQIIPNHPYGKIVAVPNARALVITENSNTIRAYIDLAKQVDKPPGETMHKTIHLERADAEDVAKALADLLGISSGVTGSSSAKSAPTQPAQPRPANPQQAAAAAAAQVATTTTIPGESESAPPKIQAIPRLNNLLVVARPVDIEYIESLVKEFDAASNSRGFISRKLRYMDVVEFASVAHDALLRGVKDSGGDSSKLAGSDNKTTTTTTPAGNNSPFGQFGSGGIGGGMSGAYGSGLSAFSGLSSSNLQEKEMAKAQSVVIGKTLLIVDPPGSRFFASGPPEQLTLLDQLADELDKRPQQILLSAVIGEFTLNDDSQFGLDWVRTLETFKNQSAFAGSNNNTGNKPVDFLSFGKITDFPAPAGLALYGHVGKYLNGFLTALETSKRFHVLQRPFASTLNHKLATISTGQQLAIPGQTLSTGSTTVNSASVVSTTQYIPVELKLDIIPHIYANDEVKLEFNQMNYDVASFTTISGNQVPNLSTQSLKNTIIVPNGSTVLLGGLITERDNKTKNGLPFLVRIPVIKYLFGSSTKTKERRELLIFVQPRILASGEDHVESQLDIVKQTESYPKTRTFADPGDAVKVQPTVPRALPVQEDEPEATTRINLNSRFTSPRNKP